MEWLVSSVWKWTKRKSCFPQQWRGLLLWEKRFLPAGLEKTRIHSGEEMNCLILWSVIECYRPERNTEEELIKDYDTVDSQKNNCKQLHTGIPEYLQYICGYLDISIHHHPTKRWPDTWHTRPQRLLRAVSVSKKLWRHRVVNPGAFPEWMIWKRRKR